MLVQRQCVLVLWSSDYRSKHLYSAHESPLHNIEVSFKTRILGEMRGHKCFHHQVLAELVGALSLALWDVPEMLPFLAPGSVVAAPQKAKRPQQGGRSWVHVPQSHCDVAAKSLTSSAMLSAAMPGLSLLTTTGTSSILSPQSRPCC